MPYRINEPDASAEIFDEEVLAINLGNGHYHSIRGTGVAMWKLLISGSDAAQVVEAMQAAYATDRMTLAADVESFVKQLLAAGLLVEDAGAGSTAPAAPIRSPDTTGYSPPIFESHADMQELLLIDPIHDVDVQVGWPLRAAPDEAA
ncbi:MAG: PqqD family protein [Planctomycetia bacterium]